MLVNLADSNTSRFSDVMNRLFKSGNNLGLEPHFIVCKYVENLSDLQAEYQRIKSLAFIHRNYWLFGYFQCLPEHAPNDFFLSELLELYEKATLNEIPRTFEFLQNYEHLDQKIIPRVIEKLFKRVSDGHGAFDFRYLLYGNGVSERISELFKTDLPLLKNIYFHQLRSVQYPDFRSEGFRKIYDLDKGFIFEYLDVLMAEKNSYDVLTNSTIDLSFLWERPDHKELFAKLLDYIYDGEKKLGFLWGPSFVEILFHSFLRNPKELGEEEQKRNTELKTRALETLRLTIARVADDGNKAAFVFQLVSNCFADHRKIILELFLKENNRFEDYKRLDFETNHVIMADGHTRIPRLESRIVFLESLLPLMSSATFLDHRYDIETRIDSLRVQIEDEKKRDFIGHY